MGALLIAAGSFVAYLIAYYDSATSVAAGGTLWYLEAVARPVGRAPPD